MRQNLVLIDGHNLLWKAYGVPFKFYSKKGTPLHVVTTFLSLLKRSAKAVEPFGGPTHLAVVFDANAPTTNHALSSTYKANRKTDYSQDADSPFNHLPNIQKILKALKINLYEKTGIEADDVIASLAAQYLESFPKGRVFIISSDSDFYQLLSGRVSQILFGKKGINIMLGPADVKNKLGVTPKQYVYFKSLTGDSSDNIKGIPNIGSVRASKIVNKSLEIDLKNFTSLLLENRKLIELNSGIHICSGWSKCVFRPKIFTLKNKELFSRLGF